MSRHRPLAYVVVALADGAPTDVFGPYRTIETAEREATRLRRVLDRENARALADLLDALANERGPFETPALVELAAVILPITGGPIRVREFGGTR